MFEYLPYIVLLVMILLTFPMLITIKSSNKQVNKLPYEKRKYLLTEAERSFMGVLELAITSKHRVFVQVRLADVLTVKKVTNLSERTSFQNQINSKHIDYVICDAGSLEICAAIELDDASHKAASRKFRDEFINQACKDAGLPLLRVPAKATYTVEAIRSMLDPVLFLSSPGPGDQTKISDTSLSRTKDTLGA